MWEDLNDKHIKNSQNNWNNINTEEKINETRFSFSWKILRIIESWWEKSVKSEQIAKYVRKYIRHSFINIEKQEIVSVFQKYFNKDNLINSEIFNSKFDKYFPIHLPILINKINQEFSALDEEWKDLSIEELSSKKENIILNLIKKYSYIIFIFWEKIRLSELEKLLNIDITPISTLHGAVLNNMNDLELKEQKQIEELALESKIINKKEFGYKQKNPLLTEPMCAITYRNTFRKVMSWWEDITIISSLNSVWEEIEQLYKLEFKRLYTIFKKWYDSDWKYWDNLFYLEDSVKKILWSISIFKSLDIAFTKTFSSNPKHPIFYQEMVKQLIDWNITVWEKKNEEEKKSEKILVELFIDFLKIVYDGWKKIKLEELVSNIELLKKITAKSRIPEVLSYIDDLDLDSVDFDIWTKTPENQKYELLFSEIIWKNWKLKISKYLKLDPLDEELILLFTESYWIDYNIDYNVVLRQFKDIKSLANANTSIKDFIKNDINNINLIVIWWRFLLKIRKLEKNKKIETITKEDIKSIKEKPYGLIEEESRLLEEKWILENEKIEFKPEWRLNNTSFYTIKRQLESIFKWFKKWPFDLSKIKIKAWNTDIPVKSITELYIPNELSGNENPLPIDEENKKINTWIIVWIDLCLNLLHGKKIINEQEKIYLKLLQAYKIVPENIEQLDTKNKDNIKDLSDTLKYIKSKTGVLKYMMEKWLKGKLKLEELLKEKWFDLWPDKAYSRAFVKLIKDHSWDFNLITDIWWRCNKPEKSIRNIKMSMVQLTDLAVEDDSITHISIVDKIWEPLSDSKLPSWYRDQKALINFKDWNVAEVQLQYEKVHDVKEHWIDLTLKENLFIFAKLKKEKKLFTWEEIIEFIRFAQQKNIKLPTIDILSNLLEKQDEDKDIYSYIDELWIKEEAFLEKNISCTYTFKIIRELEEDSTLRAKLTRLERILFDNAWADAVIEDLVERKIPID